MLYLENNLTTSAFTEARVEMLNLLFSQVAISIENASLYSSMEERIVARTSELSQANMALQRQIAEREKAEQALRESRNLVRGVIDNSPAAIFVKNLQGYYLLANQYIATQVGMTPETMVGKRAEDIFAPDVAAETRQIDNALLASGEQMSRERIIPLTDGAHIFLETRFLIHNTEGVAYAIGIIATDITELKQAHAELLRQRQTLSTLRERERLARELHDSLGQVLGFVNTQTQAIRKLLAKGQIELVDSFLQEMVTAAQETHSNVRDFILGVKAQTAPGQSFFPALQVYLEQIERVFAFQTHVEVRSVPDDDQIAPDVQAQLLRIIQEGLTNVRKHAGVHTARIVFDLLPDQTFQIQVVDAGCGFDPEAQAASTGQSYGLRVMRERIEEINGSLAIASAPDTGTCLTFFIPLQSRREEDRSTTNASYAC
jgi:PAS domain S-box-containing protein